MSYKKGYWTAQVISVKCPHCEALVENPINGTVLIGRVGLQTIADEPLAVVYCKKCGEAYRLPEITKKMWRGEYT